MELPPKLSPAGSQAVGGEFIKVMQQSESGTTLDSASAIGTNQNLWVIQVRQHPVPAGVLPARHVCDSHYKNIGNRAALHNRPNQFGEMGDPNIDAGFKALAAQDSTLLLAEAKGGTDQLFTIGLNDHRVDPWMSAKLVAMMRAKWGDQHLALIRSDADVGHGIGSTRDQALEERADIFAFLLNRFGQPGFTPSRDTPTR